MKELEAAVRAHPRVRAAMEGHRKAQEKHEKVVAEVAGLEANLAALEDRIEDVTEAGDPEGEIRELSRQRRELRDKLEDAGADLAAQSAALRGALRSEVRAILEEGMPAVWGELDVDGPQERVRDALDALAEALDEVDALRDQHRALVGWAQHLVSRILEGEGQTPTLEEPTAGLAPADLVALSRVVRGVRATIEATPEPEQVENAA